MADLKLNSTSITLEEITGSEGEKAFGRMPGWIANWKEMTDEKQPITRPRQIYTGKNRREFIEMKNRR